MNALGEVSPVSFEADVRTLPAKGMPLMLVADEAQRRGLADAHGLLAVESFEADLLLRRWNRDGVQVGGRISASIIQACVATLEPVPARIEEEVAATFVPAGSSLARRPHEAGEVVLSADGPDSPEAFAGSSIDVGALAEELFALAIDPYPRAAGTGGPAVVSTEPEDAVPDSPFAKLRPLTEKP